MLILPKKRNFVGMTNVASKVFGFDCVVMCKMIDFSTRIENTCPTIVMHGLYSCWSICSLHCSNLFTWYIVSLGLRVINPFIFAARKTINLFISRSIAITVTLQHGMTKCNAIRNGFYFHQIGYFYFFICFDPHRQLLINTWYKLTG